ncbi:MAG: hypothetical protein JWP31_2271 [Aeromicrobium sp.]|nr:hypothetical protein [Aeromicrobium sp.]
MTEEAPLLEIAQGLYSTPLAGFTAARNQEAERLKRSGEAGLAKQVKAMRKPTAGADLANRLSRMDADLMAQVRELGDRLRAAQAEADAAELRSLDQERRALVVASVRSARSLAEAEGGRATDASLRDVEQTVWAALIDAAAAAAFEAAVLVQPLSPGGFGEIDVSGASAVPIPVDPSREAPRRTRPRRPVQLTPSKAPAVGPTKETQAHERAREAARRALDAARAVREEADREVADVSQLVDLSEQELTDLEHERVALQEQMRANERAARDAKAERSRRRTALTAAERARRHAIADLDRAQEHLDALDGDV